MPKEPLQFGPNQASGLEELAGAWPIAHNVIIEATGAVRRRPGIAVSSLSSVDVIDSAGIDAVRQVENGDLYAVGGAVASQRRIYRVVPSGFVELSTSMERRLVGNSKPVLAETELLLVMAAGDFPQKVVLGDWQSSRLGGDPPRTSHIIANSLRLIANDVFDSKTTVRYSDLAVGTTTYEGHEIWSGAGTTAGSFQAEARPDPVVAIAETTNEIFLFGTKTTEIYGPDAVFVFSRIAAIEVGCIAPASLVEVDQGMFWLSNKREFVRSNGRSMEVLSSPAISRTLELIGRVDDCYGYRVKLGATDAVVWTFPTDGRTFVLQLGGGWSQWSGWRSGRLTTFGVLSHHLSDGGRNIVGTIDGRVAELSSQQFTDLTDPIDAHVETGFQDHGTSGEKHCVAVNMTWRQESGRDALAWLEWRETPGAWVGSIPIELRGSLGVHTEVEFRGLGTYRRRQWRIRFDSPGEIVLVRAEEEFSPVR